MRGRRSTQEEQQEDVDEESGEEDEDEDEAGPRRQQVRCPICLHMRDACDAETASGDTAGCENAAGFWVGGQKRAGELPFLPARLRRDPRYSHSV